MTSRNLESHGTFDLAVHDIGGNRYDARGLVSTDSVKELFCKLEASGVHSPFQLIRDKVIIYPSTVDFAKSLDGVGIGPGSTLTVTSMSRDIVVEKLANTKSASIIANCGRPESGQPLLRTGTSRADRSTITRVYLRHDGTCLLIFHELLKEVGSWSLGRSEFTWYLFEGTWQPQGEFAMCSWGEPLQCRRNSLIGGSLCYGTWDKADELTKDNSMVPLGPMGDDPAPWRSWLPFGLGGGDTPWKEINLKDARTCLRREKIIGIKAPFQIEGAPNRRSRSESHGMRYDKITLDHVVFSLDLEQST